MADPPDIRLAVAAATWWVCTAALIALPAAASRRAALALMVVGAATWLLLHRSALASRLHLQRSAAPDSGLAWRSMRHIGFSALCAAIGAAIVVSAHCSVRDDAADRLAAEHGGFVAEVVVRDDPRAIPARFGPGSEQVRFPATLRGLSDDGPGGFGQGITGARGRIDMIAPADGWLGLLPGQRVRAYARLDGSPTRGLSAGTLRAEGTPLRTGPPARLQTAAAGLRAGLRDASSGLPDDVAGLLPGLVVGDTSGLDEELVADFRAAGLSHLTAVSGTNCSILTGVLLLAARKVGLSRRMSLLVAGVGLAGFVVLVRPSPSVVRAAALGWLALALMLLGRPRTAVPALSAVVLVLLVLDPALAVSVGFALSVLATAAIVVLAPRWTHLWAEALARRRVPAGLTTPLAAALAVPLAAQLACWPLIAGIGGGLSLVAVPANILAEPAVAPATILGVAVAVVSPVSAAASQALAWLAQWPAAWIVWVAHSAANAPGARLAWPTGAAGVFVTVAVSAAAWWLLRTGRGRAWSTAVAVGCAAVTVTPLGRHAAGWPPPEWSVVACDVGQGDATVLRAGPGAAVVVDAGPEPDAVDGCLSDLGVREVPLLVLTHGHVDHVAGVRGVVRDRRVATVLVSPQPGSLPAEQGAVLRAAGARIVRAQAGQEWRIGGVRLRVLGPVRAYEGTRSDANNGSVVARADVAGVSVLLPGDVETEAQGNLVQAGVVGPVDVIKVPHHGSRYQDRDFLGRSRARVAIVEVGQGNTYGHPAAGTVGTLAGEGALVARTDLCGEIAVARGERTHLTVTARHCDLSAVPP